MNSLEFLFDYKYYNVFKKSNLLKDSDHLKDRGYLTICIIKKWFSNLNFFFSG